MAVSFLLWMSVDIRTTNARQYNDFSDIEMFIDGILLQKMEEEHIPNATVSLVADGKVVFEKGYGYANLEEEKIVDPETTMFRIGSISKLVTWTAIMQLVEEGKLDLNTDINNYLDFEIPAKLSAGSYKSEPQPITLQHLMTHTPGFEDYADSIFRLSSEEMLPLDQYVREYRPERVFPAGEVIAYSNYGTALTGYIVEQVSGMPYTDYVEENIFKPLKMNHSTFDQPLQKGHSINLAQAYRYIDGKFKEGKFEYVPAPAGGMSSTASDMATFMLAYLQGGNGILQKETVQYMFEQHFTHHPQLDGMALGFIEKTINDQKVLYHGGSTTLFDSGLYLLPQENIGLFISYSGNDFLTHTELFEAFMDHYFPLTNNMTLTPPDETKDNASRYIGEYHQNRKSFTTEESLISLTMGMIRVQANDSYLLVNHNGIKNRFMEIEPGVYQNMREGEAIDAYGGFRTIAFLTDPHGNIMLTTDGPMTYSKPPWYASSGFTFLSIIAAVLLFFGSLIYWGIKALIRRKTSDPKIAIWAKSVAIVTGILLLVLVVEVVLTGEIDPIYQLPKVALGMVPAWSGITVFIPHVLVFLGVGMLIFTFLLWWKKDWSLKGRIHYTLLTTVMLNLTWIFGYWHLI